MAEDQEQHVELTQAQQDSAFADGFNSVSAPDDYTPEVEKQEPESSQEAGKTAEETEQLETPAEEAVFAGMTESQIKSLLAKAAKVDQLEEQLRGVHGKYGELNGTLKGLLSKQTLTHVDAPATGDDSSLSEFERDFPEVVAIVEARMRRMNQQDAQPSQTSPQAVSEPQPAAAQPGEPNIDVQMAVLDEVHAGWRELVSSDDFSLWLATQQQEVQQAYANSSTAREFGSVLNQYKTAKQTTQDSKSRSKSRLEQAVIPDGKSGKTAHAPSDEDYFAAGFKSVRG